MPTQIFIDGGHGTTGLEILDRLSGRSEFSLIQLSDAQSKDASARRDAINAADIIILCLPDDAARDAVAMIDNPHTRVIDASTAHRVAPGWVYGFPEITGSDTVAQAMRVSNPGCYSTGFIALVAPLVRAGHIPADWPLTVNAVSGYSGGGKAMIAEFQNSAAATAWRTYALSLAHKHVPEMQAQCSLIHPPLFAPSVANVERGMIVDVPLMLGAMPNVPSPDALTSCLKAAYDGAAMVHVVSGTGQAQLTIEHRSGSDGMDLFVFSNEDGTQARLIAALDNLGKGASGAAVQSLNLMAGIEETAGLRV
jgi:N-acetyl-gamma-glutamyl-phosphate reductase